MAQGKRYPKELRERGVRMVMEQESQYASQWAAICSISEKLGYSTETLRTWVKQAERDTGKRPGLTTEERARLKALVRENKQQVARCTVERLMRNMRLQGAVRGKAFEVTTVSSDAAQRPRDLVNRNFTASAPTSSGWLI